MADALKAQGNAAFSSGDYPAAIEFFTKAIEVDPVNHVLFSNRSAAKASLKEYEGALEDAKKCVELKPDWAKGYSRLGAAYHGLELWDDAVTAYEKGLQLDPASTQMQAAMEEAQRAKRQGAGGPFGPAFLARLAGDARTRAWMGDPGFMQKMAMLQSNPNAIGMAMNDDQMRVALEVGLGLRFAAPGDDIFGERGGQEAEPSQPSRPAAAQEPEPAPAPEPEPELSEEERAEKERKAAAQQAKEAGNALYKQKKFEEAVEQYNKAMELDPSDISFLSNRAAVYFEMGRYEDCVADCDAAVEKGRELRADFKLVGRAITRKGNALAKLGRLEDAIAAYNKSLMEHRNADTLKRLQDTEKALKEAREREYVDLDAAAQEKELGNTAFKEQRYPEAIQHYNESLRRGPPSVNKEAYKTYSNLAACYTKLGAYPEGIKAADKCIEQEPTFAKGYVRKGLLQYFAKEYEKAVETYEVGLKHDPGNEELKEGQMKCFMAMQRVASGHASEEELAERRAKAAANPEVQQILMDPVIKQVLQEMSEDPRAVAKHMAHPDVARKISKLAAAGIVQMR